MAGRFKRFGVILAILSAFNGLYLATFWLQGADMRYAGLVLVITTVMATLYGAAYTLAVDPATLGRPLALAAYHGALGLALYLPGVLLRLLDERTSNALLDWLPVRPEPIPYAAYWVFLLAAVALSGYRQLAAHLQHWPRP